MAPKEIIFSPNAERELKKLSSIEIKIVLNALDKWIQGSKVSIEKIKAQPNFFRLRAGNNRVIYYPLSRERVVLLLIRDRKNAYNALGNLGDKLDTAFRKLKVAR